MTYNVLGIASEDLKIGKAGEDIAREEKNTKNEWMRWK